eukprot:TRINITY_DN1940_c0_g1_i1.p3 TRINITY_DN1940_c0_g1~~TRINITY_DN1940_c0_g1_i1.p3  ORF type:complete len:127 (-),score=40.61 TRINITY_DN1940_c0_g1_i1:112-492(-)
MLSPEEETEKSVTWDDQQMINQFGKLSNRKHELLDRKKAKKDEFVNLDDAADDLMLVDDDTVRYAFGEAFISVTREDAETGIDKRKEELTVEIGVIDETLKDIAKTMAELKVKLYGKFGKSINLEE